MTIYKAPLGTTFTNAEGYNGALVSIKLNDQATVEVEDSTLSDVVNKTKDTGFREAGEWNVQVAYDPANQPTLGGDDQVWTSTLPVRSGQTVAQSENITGHVTSISAPTLERGGTRLVQDFVIKANSLRSLA